MRLMILMDYDNGEQGQNDVRIMAIKKIRRITVQEISFPLYILSHQEYDLKTKICESVCFSPENHSRGK